MYRFGPHVPAKSVQPLEGYNVRVVFKNGEERIIDLDRYLHGPIFEPIRNNPAVFRRVRVEHGALTWPNHADIDPDTLYYDLTPAGMENRPEFSIPMYGGNNLSVSWDDLVDIITKLNVSDKAALLTILSEQIASTVARLEPNKREPALAIRETQAPYITTPGDKEKE